MSPGRGYYTCTSQRIENLNFVTYSFPSDYSGVPLLISYALLIIDLVSNLPFYAVIFEEAATGTVANSSKMFAFQNIYNQNLSPSPIPKLSV